MLLDFLKENGLKIENGFTNDVICVNFEQNSRSYEKEIENWQYLIDNRHSKKNPNKIYDDATIDYFRRRLQNVVDKKDLFHEMSKEDIRRKFYNEGIFITHEKLK